MPSALLSLMLVVAAAPVVAQETVKLVLLPMAPRSRTGAPIQLTAEFTYSGRRLLEGRLALDFMDGGRTLVRCESDELVLAQGRQAHTLMAPAVATFFVMNRSIEVRASLLTRSGAIDLGRHRLPTTGRLDRVFVTCLCIPPIGGDAESAQRLRDCVNISRFDPDRGKARLARLPGVSALSVRIDPPDMPVRPLAYCSFDIVVMGGEGFRALRARQLKALRRWVEAGGSLLVTPRGALKPYHVEFLQNVSGQPDGTFSLGPDGHLAPGDDLLRDRIGSYYSELGRTVIALDAPASDRALDTGRWRGAGAFLLRMRPGVRRQVRASGTWPSELNKPERGEAASFGFMPLQTGGELVNMLTPATVRILPFWAVVGVLVLFVIVIGPVDYFLLGAMKQHKFTWIFFPAVSIGFAAGTMLLANSYMGRTDRRSSWTYVDVGSGGRVLRTDRFEMIFPGRSGTVKTNVENGLFVEISHLNSGSGRIAVRGEDAPLYRGRMPGAYHVLQHVDQWKGHLSRTFSMAEAEDNSGLSWDAVRSATLGSKQWRKLADELRRGGSFEGTIFVLHKDQCVSAYGGPDPWRASTRRDARRRGADAPSFLSETSARPARGIFRLLSQISPSGGEGLEDAGVLDRQDANQCLVAAVKREGSDLIIYRRLYRWGEN